VDAPPAKKPVRTHEVHVEGDTIFVTTSEEEPNLPPGLSVGGAT
jgi:3-phenylpropionate/trans-cinnamate dioxygenase ferredoxin subunit